MCLIVLAWQQHQSFPLVVAANRDEFHARATAPAGRWPDNPHVFGGRDLEAGGTWLGANDSGRFAAVTNVREPGQPAGLRSRGLLTRDFLVGTSTAADYVAMLDMSAFSGFNLLLSDGHELWYCSNRDAAPRLLAPGIYGVSNHLLDTPWPKLATSKQRFVRALAGLPDENSFFDLLADDEIVPDACLPATGVPLTWERLLSAVFVRSPGYGTRASTLLMQRADGSGTMVERSFGPSAGVAQEVRVEFPNC
ncbi:MAG: hypothetical protein QG660_2212 [Pseudomonadota bacterium]|nr:hypothetical protein [Pseudomonadota bacterium]